MAISAPHYRLFKSLKPILPQGGSLLEIGEANWYGDIEAECLLSGIVDPAVSAAIRREWDKFSRDRFAIAKACYASLFAPTKNVAIDFGGSPSALRLDLNSPIDLGEQFDIIINHGTAEHVFNICQVFKTMHDHCIDGGLMIHESPFTGWLDHGFYNLQPTLFYDLAAANCYEIVLVSLMSIKDDTTLRLESRDHIYRLNGDLPNSGNLYVVYRKLGDMPFKVPMQGYYDGTLSETGRRAWETR